MRTQTEEQQQFLRRRRMFIVTWRSIGPLLIGGLLIFTGTMLFTAPMFINPFAVIARLRANTVDLTTLQTMAMMLPVVFVLLCVALFLLILQAYRGCKRETEYLLLIDQLQ